MFRPYFRCIGISSDTNWKDIDSAPRDGTPIEIENCYGTRPSYSLCRWVDNGNGLTGWVHVNDERRGVGDGAFLRWREYTKPVAGYIDPTNGRQETMDYWR